MKIRMKLCNILAGIFDILLDLVWTITGFSVVYTCITFFRYQNMKEPYKKNFKTCDTVLLLSRFLFTEFYQFTRHAFSSQRRGAGTGSVGEIGAHGRTDAWRGCFRKDGVTTSCISRGKLKRIWVGIRNLLYIACTCISSLYDDHYWQGDFFWKDWKMSCHFRDFHVFEPGSYSYLKRLAGLWGWNPPTLGRPTHTVGGSEIPRPTTDWIYKTL